jgi:hypothetical protein
VTCASPSTRAGGTRRARSPPRWGRPRSRTSAIRSTGRGSSRSPPTCAPSPCAGSSASRPRRSSPARRALTLADAGAKNTGYGVPLAYAALSEVARVRGGELGGDDVKHAGSGIGHAVLDPQERACRAQGRRRSCRATLLYYKEGWAKAGRSRPGSLTTERSLRAGPSVHGPGAARIRRGGNFIRIRIETRSASSSRARPCRRPEGGTSPE